MNKFYTTLLLLFFCLNLSYAQDCLGYKIIKNSNNIDEKKFKEALKKFDYERYRPKFLDYKMVFTNGIEVLLYSENSLIRENCTVVQKETYPAKEFLDKNIAYFMYSEKQGTIMAVLNPSKN